MTGRHRADVGTLAPALAGLSEALPSPGRTAAFAAVVAMPITGGMVAVNATDAYAYTVNGDGTVTVESGDTISEISRDENVSTQSTLDANGLGWNTIIRPGDVFKLGAEARGGGGSAPTPVVPQASRSTPTDSPAPAASGVRDRIIAEALSHQGLPYVYGGTSPTSGFDCSGFTQYVLREAAGVNLPRTSTAQGSAGVRVSASEARPGDLVKFSWNHIAIYAGDGYIIDSPRPGKVVSKRLLWTDDVTYRRVI